MSRKAILHIGTMKTGSTSIQTFLSKHREAMVEQGAFYPKSPGPKAHSLLTASAAPAHQVHQKVDSSIWKGMEPAARIAQFREEFDDEMAALPAHVDRVIFSDERLSFMLTAADISRLAAQMRIHFVDVEVVVYLRRQDHYLASRYAEQLRSGQIRQPDHVHRVGQNLKEYDFQALLDRWSAGFGEVALKPRIYEGTAQARFDSVADFASVCRLDLPPVKQSVTSLRPSMNFAGQQILLHLGALLQKEKDAKQVRGAVWSMLTQTVTKALPGKGWLPSREQAEAFVSRYAEGNESIRRRWHPDRPSLFSADFSEFPEQERVLNDADKFAAACSVILEALNEAAKQAEATDTTGADAAMVAGDHERAKRLLRRRFRKDGGDVAARIQMASIFIEEGRLGEARSLVNAASKLEPEAEGLDLLVARLEAAQKPVQGKATEAVGIVPSETTTLLTANTARAEKKASRMEERRRLKRGGLET